ncbi:MAG: DciA family protein [Lysobacteraceae bacterium]
MKNPSDKSKGTARADRRLQPALAARGDGAFDRLIERAQWLAALDQQLRRYLPPPLQSHCRLGNVAAGKLIFLVDAPAWTIALRRHADVLLDAATAAGLRQHALTIRVAPPATVVAHGSTPKPLSQATRDALRVTAESVADPELRAQLLKLASVA